MNARISKENWSEYRKILPKTGFITTPFGKILNYFTQTTKYIEKFNMNEFLDFLNLQTFDKN